MKSYIVASMTELYTPRAAAERLGISYPTIKQWLYRGKLRGVKTPGGHYRIPERELNLLLKADAPRAPKKKSLSASVSGRNQLQGTVSEVRFNGLLAQVKLAIGSQSVTAIITSDAARELQLKPGVRAAALIKSTEVMVVRV